MQSYEDFLKNVASQIKLVKQLNDLMSEGESYPDQLTEFQVEVNNNFQVTALRLFTQIKLLEYVMPELKDMRD